MRWKRWRLRLRTLVAVASLRIVRLDQKLLSRKIRLMRYLFGPQIFDEHTSRRRLITY